MPKNKTQKSLNTGKIQIIHGVHAVRAALLNTKRAHQELHVSQNNHEFANNYKSKIKKINILDHKEFKKLYGGEKASQGIVLKTNEFERPNLQQFVKNENADDKSVNMIESKAKRLPISLIREQNEGGYLNNKELIIKLNNQTMTIQELALQGKHNMFNSMAAAMAARVFEVKDEVIRQSMLDFQNIEHRLEQVLTVHGIDFINDSKATNVNACWFALESMQKDVVWIVGGADKGNEYSELNEMVAEKVRAIICLGENNQKIITSFQGQVETIVQASSMNEAVKQSFSLANKGEVVLLSPACASFDLFENYEDRGVQFKEAVRAL